MQRINMYGLKQEIEEIYFDMFKMKASGSIRKQSEQSNVLKVRYRLHMLTLDVNSLDEFINRVYDCFPRGSIAQMDSNIHFMRTINVLEIVVKLKIGDW